jgi:Protein of unknown function (DUF2568)
MNDGLRFLLELGVLASAAYWASQAVGGPGRWALAVALPVVGAGVWARWIAAKSVTAAPDPWRLVLEVTVFGSAAAALAAASETVMAIALAALAAVHLALTFALDQRRTARTEHRLGTGLPSLSKESR